MHIVAGDIDLYSFQSEAICRDWMAGIYFYYILFRNKQRQYIKEENGEIAYSTFVPATQTAVVLPADLAGTYTIEVTRGDQRFIGEIEL